MLMPSPGRLVEDEHVRLDEEPLGHRHLLLIAAREVEHLLGDARRLDAERVLVFVSRLDLGVLVDRPVLHELAEVRQRYVRFHVLDEDEAVSLPVLARVGEARIDRVAGALEAALLALEE
jgi:hypothetical protein